MGKTIINGVAIDDVMAKQIPRMIRQVTKHDSDKLIIIDGREGCGKSVLAMQIAKALDADFNIDKIAFNHIEFEEKIKDIKRKKGDCILLDEGFSSANSRATMSQINRIMVQMGTEMRQLNLFVIIVLPSFFDLDKYFAIHRSETLIHAYKNKKGMRGNYIIFPYKKKLKLFLKGKKFYNYGCVKSPYPACSFNKFYVVDEIEYKKAKLNAFRTKPLDANELKWKYRTLIYLIYLSKKCGVPYKVSGKLTNLNDKLIKKHIELAKKDDYFKRLLRDSGLLKD